MSKLQEEHLPCNPFHSPGHRERPGEWTNFDKTSQLCQNNPVNRYQRPALRMAGTLASQVTAGGESPVPSRGREGRTATQRTSWRGESLVTHMAGPPEPLLLRTSPRGSRVKGPSSQCKAPWDGAVSEEAHASALHGTGKTMNSGDSYFIKNLCSISEKS